MYLQGEVDVKPSRRRSKFRWNRTEPATFWVDEDAFEKQTKATVDLKPGPAPHHRPRGLGNNPAPTLRLEVRKAANSQANFAVVKAMSEDCLSGL